MKQLLTLCVAALLGLGTVSAQTAQTTTAAKQTTSTHMTKSGKADMRYKENKTNSASTMSAGPMKKDGTPDMRYKANKTSKAVTVKKTN